MFCPLRVIWPPPSMLAEVVTNMGEVNRMLCGPGPQLKVMDPPAASAVASSASVQPMAAALPAWCPVASCVGGSVKEVVRMPKRRI